MSSSKHENDGFDRVGRASRPDGDDAPSPQAEAAPDEDPQAELDRCRARSRELEQINGRLRAEVDDLKACIDGRKEHWSRMQQHIEQYGDTLAGMEQVVRDAEEKLSRKDREHELLSERIIELERRCAELAGRLRERERLQRDDERRRQEGTDEVSGLRAQVQDLREQLDEKARRLERVTAENEALRRQAHDTNQRLAALERRRDGAAGEVRSLRQELVAQQHLIGKLEAELDSKQSTIERLERQLDAGGRREDAAADANGGFADAAGAEPEGSSNVEIIHIGDLFRHEPPSERRPIAVLEAPDGTTYPITTRGVTIGRASSNDICIRREFVSRTHARLVVCGIGAIIEDAGSKNGILVNSVPVDRRVLTDGDIVSLGGKIDLKYVELDTSTRTGAPGARAKPRADGGPQA